jgi:hypothetical protein
MRAVLEVAALQGDASAAREWLQHQRWRTEMRRGKPGTASGTDQPAFVVIDSLSAPDGSTRSAKLVRSRVRPAFDATPGADPGADDPRDD